MAAHVFDPTKPALNSPRSSAEMLNQLLALSSVYMDGNGNVRIAPFKWLHYDGPTANPPPQVTTTSKPIPPLTRRCA